MSKRILSKSVLSLLLSTFVLSVSPQQVQACGGFFCQTTPIDQAGERIVFVQEGDEVVSHVQIQYTGSAKDFSWVVPVPSPPTLSVGSDQLFTMLRNATRPTFNYRDLGYKGLCKIHEIVRSPYAAPSAAPSPAAAAAATPTPAATSAPKVEVISQQEVGPFESVVLKSDDPDALKKWLRDNNYQIPENVDPLLDPYIENKFFMLALRLKNDRSSGDLQPIVMRYKGDTAMIPIRLTAVAATNDMDVYVWMLGKDRAVPVNYRHVEVNPIRLNWMRRAFNYRDVVIEAVNEANGRAFVTEFAGKHDPLFPKSTIESNFSIPDFDLEQLKALKDPTAFAVVLRNNNFLTDESKVQNFLKRYIQMPKSLDGKVNEFQFYSTLHQGLYAKEIQQEGVQVNTEGAVKELDEVLIQPNTQIKNMFTDNPYLTELYTTLDPEEMTVDPTFQIKSGLKDVSNIHNAQGIRLCEKDITPGRAPVAIKLENDMIFETEGSGEGESLSMPAAFKIQQYKTEGEPEMIRDNQSLVETVISAKNIRYIPGGSIETTPRSKSSIKVSDYTPGNITLFSSSDYTRIVTPGGQVIREARALEGKSSNPINSTSGDPFASAIPTESPLDENIDAFGCTCSNPTTPSPESPLKSAEKGAPYLMMFMGWVGFKKWWKKKRKSS